MITRFAPSPTGPLHLGHAYSALLAHDMALAENGTFLLRIEDIDRARCKPEWEAQIYDDLRWLGLWWPEPVMRQSAQNQTYRAALQSLAARDLTYPCRCNRREVELAAGAPQEGVAQFGPDGRIYPGTCRGRPMTDAQDTDVIRLDMAKATVGLSASFAETGPVHIGQYAVFHNHMTADVGDVILARRDGAVAYHLAVVVDDDAQNVDKIIRGEDLFEATSIHITLQNLLGLRTPSYHHHRLIRDDAGKRLAKRDDAKSIAKFRAEGATPTDIRRMVGL